MHRLDDEPVFELNRHVLKPRVYSSVVERNGEQYAFRIVPAVSVSRQSNLADQQRPHFACRFPQNGQELLQKVLLGRTACLRTNIQRRDNPA